MVTGALIAGVAKLKVVSENAFIPFVPLPPGEPGAPGTLTVWVVAQQGVQGTVALINIVLLFPSTIPLVLNGK